MRWLILTFKNIGKFIRFHPVMFLFLIFAQVVCCLTVFVSCGMSYNLFYTEEKVEKQYFCYIFEDNDNIHLSLITEFDDKGNREVFYWNDENGDDYNNNNKKIYELEHKNAIPIRQMDDNIKNIIDQLNDYTIIDITFRVEYNRNTNMKEIPLNEIASFYPPITNYSNLSKKFIDSKEKILLIPLFLKDGSNAPSPFLQLGESVEINGDNYQCAGDYERPFVPYYAMNDDFVVTGIWMTFDNMLNRYDIQYIRSVFDNEFQAETSETYIPEPIDPNERQLSYMIYVISLIVMLIVLLAIAKYYSFILETRRSNLAILRLCGCSREASHIIYLSEMMLTMLVTSAVGYAVFRYVLLEPIAEMYPSFTEFYSGKVFLIILLAYFLIAGIIMTVTVRISTRSSIEEMRKQ